MTASSHRYIDACTLSLDEWLGFVKEPPHDAMVELTHFPTDTLRDQYLATADQRTDEEIRKLLLNLLLLPSVLGVDKLHYKSLVLAKKKSPDFYNHSIRSSYSQRVIRSAQSKWQLPVWDGITWIIDLLPDHAREALGALSAFIQAHIAVLPDGRICGLSDAEAIIRAKYIGMPTTTGERLKFLMEVAARSFEVLIQRLYISRGYETKLTAPQRDGGRDIIAWRNTPGSRDHLQIECKRHSNPVAVKTVRALLGVVSAEKATRGVLVTTSRFTKGSEKFSEENPRVELVDGVTLVAMLNEYLGSNWPAYFERLVRETPATPATHQEASDG